MYSLRRKLYTNYTQTLHSNYTQSPTKRRPKPYTASVRKTIHEAEHKPYILFLNTNCSRMERMEFRTRMGRMERIVRNVCNERNERDERNKRNERDERNKRNERNERKTGNGNRR